MSLHEAKQLLSEAMKKKKQLGSRSDPLLVAACGALARMTDAMIEADARLGRIEEELSRIAQDIDRLG